MLLARLEGDAADDEFAAELVARVHEGDDLAFAELYVHYSRRVHRYLSIALKNPEDAQEATQDVFVKVLKHLGRYEQRSEPFANWLFRVVRNHALDFQKRQWRTEAVDPHELARRGRPTPQPDDDGAGIGALIDGLSRDQRRVMTLIYVYDFGVADIAEALGKTPDAIRHLHMRALKAVGAKLPDSKRRRRLPVALA